MEQLAALLLLMQPAAEAPCAHADEARSYGQVCEAAVPTRRDDALQAPAPHPAPRRAVTLSPDFSASLNGGVGREPGYILAPTRRVFVTRRAPVRVSAGEAVRRAAGRE